jgi:hypothetical protein
MPTPPTTCRRSPMPTNRFHPHSRVHTPATLALLTLLFASAGHPAEPLVRWQTQVADFAVDTTGAFTQMTHTDQARNCLAPGQPAPILSMSFDGRIQPATRATWDATTRRLALGFADPSVSAVLAVTTKPTHLTFEVVAVQPSDRVDCIVWGPYPTSIGEIVGETIGVVRDADTALGIQALNPKTLGGFPTEENDADGGFGADDPGRYPDLPSELGKGQSFRGDTARPTPFGSVLQAYCRTRNHDRIVPNWGHDKYLVPAFDDGGALGSKIALFACPATNALATLGAIEIAEGLPHPLLDGVWGKASPAANASYLIVDFGENTIDRAIAMTRRAGLNYLYHSSPFETWGHFRLKPNLFPKGWDGLRACVEKARTRNVRLGVHTLSNFITPNDPYVTPDPDPRLARVGNTTLDADLDAARTEIPISTPDFVRKKTDLDTVVINKELIRYRQVSTNAPWRLLDCQRGAWGTRATAHPRGSTVGKLMDHGYKVFLTDADLAREVARNIANLCNQTGVRQISFDGLEGNWSTGMGQYGRTLFTTAWYDALGPDLRGQVINDASNPCHFNWHIYTRMNWGEPWYAGFRESQTLYRFKNQLYFERNLMPRMLGWFALRPETSLEDAEWLLARAAGYNAGFALASSLASTAQLDADPKSADAARDVGALPALLEAVRHWETARLARAFPDNLRTALRDNTREFHLEPTGPGSWTLHEFHLQRFALDCTGASPVTNSLHNPYPPRALRWLIRNSGKQNLPGLTLHLDGIAALSSGEVAVPPGGFLRYSGGATAVLYTPAWKELARIPVESATTFIGPGDHDLRIACAARTETKLTFEFSILAQATPVRTTTTP